MVMEIGAHKRRVKVMTDLVHGFFYTLPRNILRAFWGHNFLWHILAIGATALIVSSGFDWVYFEATRPIARYLFSAVILGWRVPIVFPIVSYVYGFIRKDRRAICSAYATAQAALVGVLISSFYKALTGRPSPRHSFGRLVDTSREFHFGLLRGGVFFGWPSSHATVAFAMAAAVWKLYPNSRIVRRISFVYSLYIGIGVSMTIHWFSDFVAGAILGMVIGTVVGNVFKD